ncbi:MAG: hypothetical protein IT221_01860 [Fluviicola sp.]|nr:hypothetical protein [Fluviicola sp.]
MATPNINHSKLGAFCIALSLFFFLGCKKNDVLLFKVAVQCEIPYDHTPIPGVKFKVVEYSSGGDQLFGPSEPTGFEMQGITGTNGRAVVAFTKRRKDTKNRYYQCFFDYSSVESPYPDYTLINTPQFIDVFANDPKEIYLKLLPKTSYHFKVENQTCFDENDRIRWRVYNYDSNPNSSFDDTSPWGSYHLGCGVIIDYTNSSITSGHEVYQYEVTRNGQVNTFIDTFLILPNQENEVFIQY